MEWFSVARQGDRVNTGHLCDTSTTILAGSPNVFVNGIPVARVGDDLAAHTISSGDKCIPHLGQKVNAGSSRVFANKRGIARVTDSADLGTIAIGSQDVFSR